ncbi:MAG: hypothetical protein J6X18_14960 [Bacteroidales bacterium]|nr:hypothetical protein [Bacteroidales bacterium]
MVNIVETNWFPTFDVVANFNGERRIVGGYLLCSNVKYDVAKGFIKKTSQNTTQSLYMITHKV